MRDWLLIRSSSVSWLIGGLVCVLVSGSVSLATPLSPESSTIVSLLNEVVAASQASRSLSDKVALMEEVMVTQSQMGDEKAADLTYDRLSETIDEQVKETREQSTACSGPLRQDTNALSLRG